MRGYGIPQAMFAFESCTEDICHKFGFDPTVMSGPLLSTFIDVCGLSIYFEITKLILAGF